MSDFHIGAMDVEPRPLKLNSVNYDALVSYEKIISCNSCPRVRKQKHVYRRAEMRGVAAMSVTVDVAVKSLAHEPVDILKRCRPISSAFDRERIKMQPADGAICFNDFPSAVVATCRPKSSMSVACIFKENSERALRTLSKKKKKNEICKTKTNKNRMTRENTKREIKTSVTCN